MSTATKTFDKRSLYHSDLAKVGEVTVQFTGKPRDSQYPGKPRWVGLMIQGDDTKYTLNIENADVEKSIAAAPLNAWVSVRAEGRGDQAFMLIEDGNGSPMLKGDTRPAQPVSAPLPRNPQASGPPANEWPDETTPTPTNSEDDATRKRLADRYYLALSAAQEACNRFATDHQGLQPSDAVRNIATTIFIQASGR